MQSLFAYAQCQEANFNLGLANIEEAFQPDLNSMEAPDHEALKKNRTQAQQLFTHKVKGDSLEKTETFSEEAEIAANNAFKAYDTQVKKDFDHLSKQMVIDAESLIDRFLEVVTLILEWAQLSRTEADKKKKIKSPNLFIGDYNLSQNQIVQYFRNAQKLNAAIIKKGIQWGNEEDHLKSWYKDLLKKDEAYSAYRHKANPTFDEDKEIIEHLVKQLIFKSEMILSFFDEKDICWKEDKAIVRSLVTRCIRDLEEESDPASFDLPDFSNNWEDDRIFFEDIFNLTVQNDEAYSKMIAEKTKNWEVDRLAITDQIILKMGITEMINFKSIPVKVTINEYIELSKNYSTPKSKQFVNGILDVISEELKAQGVLKKSGRGLIDNK